MKRYPNENIIILDYDSEINIKDLISRLADLLREGYKTIKIETELVGDGNNEDGSNEYEYYESKLVAEF